MDLFDIFLKSFLSDNIVFMSFIALCAFIGMSDDAGKSIGMGVAVTFVTVLATCATFPIFHFILKPLDLGFLEILAFILVIAALVQLVEFFLKKNMPGLYSSMGIYLALITTNCAILAVALNNISRDYNFVQSLVYSLGVALGFLFAMLLMVGVRQRMRNSPVPAFLKGTPILFMASGIMSLSFMGFTGL